MTSHRTLIAFIGFLFISALIASPAYMRGDLPATSATNSPPVAADDSYSVHGYTQLGNLLANDSDPDGDGIYFDSYGTLPQHGSFSGPNLAMPGYSPTSGYVGTDTFTYRICDYQGACSAYATVTLNITNASPVVVDDSYQIHTSLQTNLHSPPYGVLSNDSDPDGDSMTCVERGYVITAHGTASLTYQGNVTYYPNSGYVGPDSMTYRVCDNLGGCADGNITFSVVNQPPTVVDDLYVVRAADILRGFGNYDTAYNIPPNGARLNDSDPDGDNMACEQKNYVATAHGFVSVWADGRVQYTPNSGFFGADSTTYTVCDSLNACSTGTISFYVIGEGENDGAASCEAGIGKPVNVTNGNMYVQQTDYSLPSVGAAIVVTRTFNSNSQRTGLFGKGWSTIYDQSVVAYDSSLVRLNEGDGRSTYFSRPAGSSGAFAPLAGDFHGQLAQSGGGFTLSMTSGSVEQFNFAGKLISIADRNNNQTTLSYDGNGHLASITNPFGRVLTVTTNGNGQALSISDSMGTIANYTYGAANELLSVTYADNSGYQFSYDGANRLTTVTDALGDIVESHTYDGEGRAITSEKHGGAEHYTLNYISSTETDVTDALGHMSKYTFDPNRGRNLLTRLEGLCSCGGGGGSQVQTWTYDNQLNVTSKTDALNHTTTFTYDANGNRLTKTDILGTTQYTYNAFGQVLTATDALGAVTTLSYDAQGNPLTLTNALNKTTAFAYDPRGQLLSITDARSKVTSFAYDASGNLIKTTDALGHDTTVTYDARGRLTSETNVLGNSTAYEYDAVGRLIKATEPNDSFVTITYDLGGRRTSLTDARGNSTAFVYDDADRLVSETDAAGGVTAYGYDLMSHLTSRTDALGHVTNYEYDDFNRLAKTIYPPATSGATRLEERVEYDAAGNASKRIDTAGRETRFEYDGANRLVKTIDPLQQATQYEYNALSEMTAVVDALGQRYVFVYDQVGRLKRTRRGGQSMTFTYDAVGNRKQRTDYNGATTVYTYNALNRMTEIAYPDTTTVTYSYDKLGRLKTATNEQGTVSFGYNRVDRLTSATDVFGQVVDYSYDLNGNRTKATLNAATIATYRYDVVDRLTKLIDEAGAATTYAYDAAGRPISRRLPNGVVTTQEYDGLDRLARLKHAKGANLIADNQYQYNTASQISQIAEPATTRSFAYDPTDRLTSMTSPTLPGESYAYDAVGNRTASHLSATYTHQPVNKLTQTSTATFSYDNNGNLISKTDGTGTWTYTWDFENRLKQVTRPDGITVSYKYDPLGRRIQRTPSNGVFTNYTYDGQDVVLDQNSDGSTVRYLNGPGIDNKLRQTSSTGALYFAQDHLGSTRALTSANGSLVESINYDSFGKGASSLTRYGYTGREWDGDTGLYYYRNRWYDPQVGRFISEDPIGLEGGINLYTYVESNPLTFSDPFGLQGVGYSDLRADREVYQARRAAESPTCTGGIMACYERNKFSSLFEGVPVVHEAVKFLEDAGPISFATDLEAMALKGRRSGVGGPQPYASGFNWIGGNLVRAVGRPDLVGKVKAIGDRLTPFLAVTAVFTGSYNATIWVQCFLGILK